MNAIIFTLAVLPPPLAQGSRLYSVDLEAKIETDAAEGSLVTLYSLDSSSSLAAGSHKSAHERDTGDVNITEAREAASGSLAAAAYDVIWSEAGAATPVPEDASELHMLDKIRAASKLPNVLMEQRLAALAAHLPAAGAATPADKDGSEPELLAEAIGGRGWRPASMFELASDAGKAVKRAIGRGVVAGLLGIGIGACCITLLLPTLSRVASASFAHNSSNGSRQLSSTGILKHPRNAASSRALGKSSAVGFSGVPGAGSEDDQTPEQKRTKPDFKMRSGKVTRHASLEKDASRTMSNRVRRQSDHMRTVDFTSQISDKQLKQVVETLSKEKSRTIANGLAPDGLSDFKMEYLVRKVTEHLRAQVVWTPGDVKMASPLCPQYIMLTPSTSEAAPGVDDQILSEFSQTVSKMVEHILTKNQDCIVRDGTEFGLSDRQLEALLKERDVFLVARRDVDANHCNG